MKKAQVKAQAPLGLLLGLDLINLLIHILLYSLVLTPLLIFLLNDSNVSLFSAFAAALVLLPLGILLMLISLALVVRQTSRGLRAGAIKEFGIGTPESAPWGFSVTVFMIFRRSYLKNLLHSFNFGRWMFYSLIGGKVHYRSLMGLSVDITDPWITFVSERATLGDYCFLNAHEVSDEIVYSAPIHIGPGATIGHHSNVGPGARIGAGAVVASGSLVLKDTQIPDGEIWGGIPARPLRPTGASGCP